MEELCCPGCGEYIEIGENLWDYLGDEITCSCGVRSMVSYDESYDSETGDSFGWFYLEK